MKKLVQETIRHLKKEGETIMYPLKFTPIYCEKVWGGRTLENYRSNLPEGNIGESWDLACHNNGMSVVSNGEYKGLTLEKLIEQQKEKLVGTKLASEERFPLLIKLLDAKDRLSIQVHPNDEYALKAENDLGKTEVWYIMEATQDASMVLGASNCTRQQFKKAIEETNLEPCLNRVSVKKGEVYFIKSGLIHAMEGVLVAEIQQNSDTTYRVYDYGRPRELHIEKALDVMDMSLKGENGTGLTNKCEGYDKTYYCYDKNFSLERYDIKEKVTEESDTERFYVFTCIEGKGKIISGDYVETVQMGETIMIPASLGSYSIEGELSLLKSYVPDLEKLEKEIISVVKK